MMSLREREIKANRLLEEKTARNFGSSIVLNIISENNWKTQYAKAIATGTGIRERIKYWIVDDEMLKANAALEKKKDEELKNKKQLPKPDAVAPPPEAELLALATLDLKERKSDDSTSVSTKNPDIDADQKNSEEIQQVSKPDTVPPAPEGQQKDEDDTSASTANSAATAWSGNIAYRWLEQYRFTRGRKGTTD